MDYISIGKRIAKTRKKRKITQEQLAEELDSSSTYISNIERAAKKPSLKMLVKIASILEISLDYLVMDNYSNDKMKNNIELHYITTKLSKLCKNNRRVYLDISNNILDRLIQSEKDEKQG